MKRFSGIFSSKDPQRIRYIKRLSWVKGLAESKYFTICLV
ncbi:hypothetical protein A45J_0336 [hot springs metagenome]|uniref:Uncharacterized protein n=1 Tax=hot springs metagenome TaxID=433727 RepID=A0A5J4KSF1_9ZZZZ